MLKYTYMYPIKDMFLKDWSRLSYDTTVSIASKQTEMYIDHISKSIDSG